MTYLVYGFLGALCYMSLALHASMTSEQRVNRLAVEFYQNELKDPKANQVFCPLNLYESLAMVYAGAGGQTERELEMLLHLSSDRYRGLFELSQLVDSLSPLDPDKGYNFLSAKSLWIDIRSFILPSFLTAMKSDFHADVETLSFDNLANAAWRVNNWVDEMTCGTIARLLSSEDISRNTKLMLVSTLYFKGDWQSPFKAFATKKENFYVHKGDYKKVEMLHQVGDFLYHEDDVSQTVFLPFRGKSLEEGTLAFFACLPKDKESKLRSLVQEDFLSRRIAEAQTLQLDLSLPKFEFCLKYNLIPALEKMGVKQAFSSKANFSKINGQFNLCLDKAIQEVYFSLDEGGVEASSATAVSIGATCVRIPSHAEKVFAADHPFVFGIVDLKSNVMLFLGKVLDP